MKLKIRVAALQDLSAVTRLLARIDTDESPMPLARAERIFRAMAHYPDYRCYLALDGDEAVGTFTLLVFDALVHGGAREAMVDGVVVAPERRGQGIGRAMLKEAMRIARESGSGCYKLALSSNNKRVDAH